ncbi:MAG: hypothetical protein WBD08_16305, partial [Candidatus Acidiferrales bacterium]
MGNWLAGVSSLRGRFAGAASAALRKAGATGAALTMLSVAAHAQGAPEAGGEANLKVPDLSQVSFLGVNGHT